MIRFWETISAISLVSTCGLAQKKLVNAGEQKIKINLEAEAAGIYTAVLSGGGKSYSGKIVFE